MSDGEKFHGLDVGWMQSQWRDCSSRKKQLNIFRDLTGASFSEIIKILGVERETLDMSFLERSCCAWSKEDIECLIRMVRDGSSDGDIAIRLKRTDRSVSRMKTRLRKSGIELPVRSGKKEKDQRREITP